jgi:Avidin family
MGMEGTWYSQQQAGSKLVILPVAEGILTGRYEAPTSGTSCAKGEFPLQGRTDVGRGGSTFGFAVTWLNAESNCHSTTAWAGQYAGTSGNETLTAFWVRATQTTHESGEDHFTRVAPSGAGAGAGAHP